MSGRRGFALVAVLWVVVALASLTLAAASLTQVAAANAESRIVELRGRWAADACIALGFAELADRAARGATVTARTDDSLALADGSRCTLAMGDSTGGRIIMTARGRAPEASRRVTIDVLAVSAGSRVAAVRRRVW